MRPLYPTAAWLQAALVLAAVAALTPSGGQAAPARPQITITNPPDGAVLTGEAAHAGRSVTVSVAVDHLDLVPADTPNQPGQGHLHFRLDDRDSIHHVTDSKTFTGLAAGQHTVVVEAVKNDHSSFDPPVRQTISFTSRPASSVRWAWILGGGFIAVILLLAWYLRRAPL